MTIRVDPLALPANTNLAAKQPHAVPRRILEERVVALSGDFGLPFQRPPTVGRDLGKHAFDVVHLQIGDDLAGLVLVVDHIESASRAGLGLEGQVVGPLQELPRPAPPRAPAASAAGAGRSRPGAGAPGGASGAAP